MKKLIGIGLVAIANCTAFLSVNLIAQNHRSSSEFIEMEFESGRAKLVPRVSDQKRPVVDSANPSALESKEGGKFLASNGIVYGKSEVTLDPLFNERWFNRSAAALACRTKNTGGHQDWRLPTEEELLAATKYSSRIGFDPYLYYWTSKIWMEKQTDSFTKKLDGIANYKEEISNKAYVDGWNYDTNERRYVGSHTTKIEYDKLNKVDGTYLYDVNAFKLVRPVLGEGFDLKNFTLTEKAGVLHFEKIESSVTVGSTAKGSSLVENLVAASFNSSSQKSTVLTSSVDPDIYFRDLIRKDIKKNQIGLLCVREGSKKLTISK